jgi:hypothetical protein
MKYGKEVENPPSTQDQPELASGAVKLPLTIEHPAVTSGQFYGAMRSRFGEGHLRQSKYWGKVPESIQNPQAPRQASSSTKNIPAAMDSEDEESPDESSSDDDGVEEDEDDGAADGTDDEVSETPVQKKRARKSAKDAPVDHPQKKRKGNSLIERHLPIGVKK